VGDLHYHFCPICFEHEACGEDCTLEPTLGVFKGKSLGFHACCSKCEHYTWPCCEAMGDAAKQGDAVVREAPGLDGQQPSLLLVHGGWQALSTCPWCGEDYAGREPKGAEP
jgi:hypothetical protein